MISVEEALAFVLAQKQDFGTEQVPLLQATGRVLAQQVKADRDLPPFDRVMMDGIAFLFSAFEAGQRTFRIAGIQPAGAPQLQLQDQQACLEVMTGAMLPQGADVVAPYEACTLTEGEATVNLATLQRYQHVHRQAIDSSAGDVLLQPGERITPAHVSILASVGLAQVQVRRLPKVAVFSTGDELVEVTQQPEPHQIRKSNVYMLAAALLADGLSADLFHLPDEPDAMAEQVTAALATYDVLLFSGAVSKGKYDFLPEVLAQAGMRQVFHKVAQKPGKPFLFGTFPAGALAFGFPGNPVSSFVCFHIFFRPWLYASLGLRPDTRLVRLKQDVAFAPDLTYHVPVQLQYEASCAEATPITGSGSGDLTSILHATAIMTLPPDRKQYTAGECFPATLL
ncbi:molybdopterin molybdotransferase MoeA [Pontibacter chitinilyticus]|uniref:molybdopterin molybdotransferase MoeA n=1 Tax=Pontibacter chitinilyticus TaxID=2674989 RepID=UPI00321B9B48